MIEVKRILFPTDFSPHATEVLKFAVHLAQKFNAELYLFHAIVLYEDDPNNPDHRFPDLTESAEQIKQIASDRLDSSYADYAGLPIKVHKETRRGISAYQEIIEFAKEKDIDLIVIGTHGRSGLSHLLLGSVTEKVVRYAPCPVLTIGKEAIKRPLPLEVKNILVPVDFSTYSAEALKYAVSVGELYGSRLHLLYVVEEPVYPAFYSSGTFNALQILSDLPQRAKRAMTKFLKENAPTELKVVKEVRDGKPEDEILQYADEKKIDLIVMATHGLSGLDRFLLGSTTERVIRKAKCPVLSVKLKKEED
ncbi:MAG TPA: universal stress protein [Bacteroidetes bacterium]|nr:universal stress protein [Bacteroidota bacterium]